DRGTPEELAMVKGWVNWCDNGHRSCVRNRRALPSRLIDVSNSPSAVRLVDTASIETEPYATLSYCWGKSQPLVTTAAALVEHMQELEVGRLPRTLQDGIKATRALGLKYLWVDSLCIIQDSIADREREISRMQQIFQNSHVTIVAARARDCNEGFLQAERSRDPLAKLPVLCASGQVGNMMLLPRKQRLIQPPTREPLHERGWTLQEIVLSPRLLIYGRELTVWRCTAGEKVHECSTGRHNPLDWNGYCAAAGLTTIRLSPRGRIHQPRLSTHSPPSMFTQQSERLPKLFRTWKFVVHDYTTRHLSDPMDKLPALNGIVTYFRDAMEDRYLAGLWEKHLLHELSWLPSCAPSSATVIAARNSPSSSPTAARRPPAYRAPSWSWMSIDAAISFQADACSWYEPAADVVDARVTPAFPDAPFSRVTAGTLTLHGFLKPNVPSLLSPRTPFAVAGVDDAAAGAYGTIYLDVPGEEASSADGGYLSDGSGGSSSLVSSSAGGSRRYSQGVYWCFMLARCFTRTPAEEDEVVDIETVWGLALALRGEEFERVGYWVGAPHCRAWFESGGKRDVTIV
ncbi:heterokaryon incompatibility protein-domain-containing protein, partial [Macrophomina phaseolina]